MKKNAVACLAALGLSIAIPWRSADADGTEDTTCSGEVTTPELGNIEDRSPQHDCARFGDKRWCFLPTKVSVSARSAEWSLIGSAWPECDEHQSPKDAADSCSWNKAYWNDHVHAAGVYTQSAPAGNRIDMTVYTNSHAMKIRVCAKERRVH